jgi:hypothetical protein
MCQCRDLHLSQLQTTFSLAKKLIFAEIIIVKTYKQNRLFFEQLFFTLDASSDGRVATNEL